MRDISSKSRYSNYRTSHTDKGRSKYYDTQVFSRNSYSYRVWQLEKIILKKLFSKINRNNKNLDFACGTGRVISYLDNDLNVTNLTGIDISAEMLGRAKDKIKSANLIQKDITRDNIKNLKFDNIVSFRFFLNAENNLRKDVLLKLNSLLDGSGKLIFNIHGNKNSLFQIMVSFHNFLNKTGLAKLFLGRDVHHFKSLSVKEVKELLAKTGFILEKKIYYAYIPYYLHRLFPKRLYYFLEKKLIFKNLGFGTHIMIVARKNEKK